ANPPRRMESGTLIAANGDRGRFVGQLRFDLGADGKPALKAAAQLPLDQSIPADSTCQALIAEYKAQLAAAQRASAGAQRAGAGRKGGGFPSKRGAAARRGK